MAFRTKDFLSIVAGGINWMRGATTKITDYRIGSVSRTMFEAVATEMDEMYQNMLRGLVDAIPTAIYQGFGFPALPEVSALGIVTFSVAAPAAADVLIPAGTVVSTQDQLVSYVTLADSVILTGETTATASISCTAAGTVGNVGSGQVTSLQGGPPGVSVTNAAPIGSGRDAETEDERAQRFLDYVQSLSRGPLASIEYGLRLASLTNDSGVVMERVLASRALERYAISGAEPLGYVDAYIYNGSDGASVDLIAAAQRIIDGYRDITGAAVIGWKGAGIVVRVKAVEIAPIDLLVLVRTPDGQLSADQVDQMTDNMAAYINSVPIGEPVYHSALSAAAKRVAGIKAVYLTPGADITFFTSVTKVIPGNFTFEALPV